MIRMKLGFSLSKVSVAAGTSQDLLREYESGKREIPDDETLERIADALFVSVDCLKDPENFKGGNLSAKAIVNDVPDIQAQRLYNKNYDATISNILQGKRFSSETYKVYNCYRDYVEHLPVEIRTEEHKEYLAIVDTLIREAKPKRKRPEKTGENENENL